TATIALSQFIGSIWNCVSDRTEDELDHPQRVVLCDQIGYPRLRSFANRLLVIFVGLIVLMTLTCDLSVAAIAMWFFFQLMTWSYSLGPRLKPRRFGATFFLGGVSGYFLVLGWIGEGFTDMTPVLAAGLILGVMGASLTGSKDAPDIEGDQAAGYRSVYHDLVEANRPFLRAAAILTRPYIVASVLSLLTLSGGPGWRLLWCWVAFPLALALAWALTHAETPRKRSVLRDLGYLYWLTFMGAVLISLFPSALTVGIFLVALCWYPLLSQLLHPDPNPWAAFLRRDLRQGLP
ncbi:MAG TPA: UbiA family prenyltransferase, partial [Solirubrobacterales bacterium]